MANLRRRRISPSGLEAAAPLPAKRRWPWVAGAVAIALIALAWFDGGEEPLRPIVEDLALPEQAQ